LSAELQAVFANQMGTLVHKENIFHSLHSNTKPQAEVEPPRPWVELAAHTLQVERKQREVHSSRHKDRNIRHHKPNYFANLDPSHRKVRMQQDANRLHSHPRQKHSSPHYRLGQP
jgi:hypothetical protein